MKFLIIALASAALTAGCAEERIVQGSDNFYPKLNGLGEQEVIENIDATIDTPDRIPTRTTFGKGTLTFSDNLQGQLSLPLHLYGKTPGSVGGNFGTYTDTYAVSINPDVDPSHLAALRDVYRRLVYPRDYRALIKIPEGGQWLFWKNVDGSPSTRPPPQEAYYIGTGHNHVIYSTNVDAFYRFVLITYGYLPSDERGITVNPLNNPIPQLTASPSGPTGRPNAARPTSPPHASVGQRPAPTFAPRVGERPGSAPSPVKPQAGTDQPNGVVPAGSALPTGPVGIPGLPTGRPNTLQEELGGRRPTEEPLLPPPNNR